MCGILGVAGSEAAGHQNVGGFDAALDLLAHRGPDDRGVYAGQGVLLGHRRLSIIDLTAAGHQPMVEADIGAVIVFNGEIYNYLELRRELEERGHHFVTETDTEVLLKSYLEWGAECLKRLNGMWAFAIWLPATRKLFLSRDRFGVKPLYFLFEKDRFAFSSEPKALLSLFPAYRKVDPKTLYQFLAQGKLYTEGASFYAGISVLPPAHCAEYQCDSGELRQWRYWDYPAEATQNNGDIQSEIEEFSDLLEDAIKLRLRSDVPVGVTLSGGLDSTAVLAGSMSVAGGERICLTSVYGPKERGEAGWAALASAPYGIEPIEVEAPSDQLLDTLRKISWHMDGPGYSPAVYPLWFLMQQARNRGILVLLEGQGADEVLGGYPQYAALELLQQLRHCIKAPSPARFREIELTWRGMVRTFTPRWTLLWLLREAFPALIGWNRRRVGAGSTLRKEFAETFKHERGATESASLLPRYDASSMRLWQDHSRDILPGLLHYGDSIGMAHGVESRLPFMDYRLVEWLFSRSSAIKIRSGETKWVLREYLRRHGQQKIGNRPDKLGYPTPVEKWLAAKNGAVSREILLTPNAKIHAYCEPDRLQRLIEFHAAGKPGAGNHLYRLVSTELWLQTCIH
jgi:asparagine synthase (glutamine-hydrolysing)